MLFFLATCISLLLPSWALIETKLLSMSRLLTLIRRKMSLKKTAFSASSVPKAEAEGETGEEENRGMSVLDLPELALDSILERLPPLELRTMAGVCTSLRDRCLSDHLWERHMSQKWGNLMGPAARREWRWYIAAASKDWYGDSPAAAAADCRGQWKIPPWLLSWLRPFSWFTLRPMNRSSEERRPSRRSSVPVDSMVSWYTALETGKFSFPAQVFNRENGHVGFLLSCYDADLCYDPRTDSFTARYPPHGRRATGVEDSVPWERLRAPPMDTDTSPHDLHISDCLDDLRPGDHIEIQWRRNKEFPYGWWYGIVGHLESCDGSENFCRCHNCDSVVLDFNQYTQGSRWRQTTVSRKEHREEGNEANGFYGGIRKLRSSEEISTWKRFWPTGDLQ